MSKLDPTSIFCLIKTPYDVLLTALRNKTKSTIPGYLHDNHLMVLFAVDREFGSNQKQLADKLLVSKQSIGVTIDFLVEKKYLFKIKDPVDGRANLIKLQDKGWKLIEINKSELLEILEIWKQKIGSKNFKKLMSILLMLNQKL